MLVASVDIGTNTVRCLIGNFTDGELAPLDVRREIVRLGAGFRVNGTVEPGAVQRLQEVLSGFGKRIREAGCSKVLAVGTSLLRDMEERGDDAVAGLDGYLGFSIRIISGEEEALLTSTGVSAGIGGFKDGLVLDIGGGSTEIVRLSGEEIVWWESVPEGVVHLTEQYLADDPPSARQVACVRERFRPLLDTLPDDCGQVLAGTAGTPTTLAALELGIDDYDPTLVNGHVLSRKSVASLAEKLLSMEASARLRLPGMEAGREDLIIAGAAMVEEAMDRWGFSKMVVSDWGLLEGAALAAAKGSKSFR